MTEKTGLQTYESEPNLMSDPQPTTSTKLRALADLIDSHPDLPSPYISAGGKGGGVEAHWYLHIWADDLTEQKITAAAIIRALGGTWDKNQATYGDDSLAFTQTREGLVLDVVVDRAAVCKRVVTGTHEVTVPAEPARPAQDALPERTTTVEDVTWVCSSLLSPADDVPAAVAS